MNAVQITQQQRKLLKRPCKNDVIFGGGGSKDYFCLTPWNESASKSCSTKGSTIDCGTRKKWCHFHTAPLRSIRKFALTHAHRIARGLYEPDVTLQKNKKEFEVPHSRSRAVVISTILSCNSLYFSLSVRHKFWEMATCIMTVNNNHGYLLHTLSKERQKKVLLYLLEFKRKQNPFFEPKTYHYKQWAVHNCHPMKGKGLRFRS